MDIEKATNRELEIYCAKNGLPQRGGKGDLAARVKKHLLIEKKSVETSTKKVKKETR